MTPRIVIANEAHQTDVYTSLFVRAIFAQRAGYSSLYLVSSRACVRSITQWAIGNDAKLRQSPHWGLNPGRSVYKTDAVPLSYRCLANTWGRQTAKMESQSRILAPCKCLRGPPHSKCLRGCRPANGFAKIQPQIVNRSSIDVRAAFCA